MRTRLVSKVLFALVLALAPLHAEAAKTTTVREGTGITGLPADIYDRIVAAAQKQGEQPSIVQYEGMSAVLVPGDAKSADIYYLVGASEIVVVTVSRVKNPATHTFRQDYARYILAQDGIVSGLAATATPLPAAPAAPAVDETAAAPAPAADTRKRLAYVSAYSSVSFAKADLTMYELKVEVETQSFMGAEMLVGATIVGYRAATGTGGYEPCPADSCAVTGLLDPLSTSKKIIGFETNLGVMKLYFPVP